MSAKFVSSRALASRRFDKPRALPTVNEDVGIRLMTILRIEAIIRDLGHRGHSFRVVFVGLVAAILMPALLFGGWLAYHSAGSERALLERNAESKGRQVLVDVEHELDSAKAMLIALASSHFLQTENFEEFHRQIAAVARQLGAQFVLRDAVTGRQIVNATVLWGRPLPQDIPAQVQSAMEKSIRTGRPAVSDVFLAPLTKKFVVSVGIPIRRDERVRYYLSVGIPLDIFADALKNAALPDQWLITLVDRDNNIIARSERQQEVAGAKLLVDFASQARGFEGVTEGTNRFGIKYRWTWLRSANGGWFVSIGVPMSVLEAPAKRALLTYTAASGSLFVFAILISYYLGGRLGQSMGTLGIDRTPTKEEFRILFESAPNGVLVVDDKGRIVLANERLEQKFGYTHGELIGLPAQMLFPERDQSRSRIPRPPIVQSDEHSTIVDVPETFGCRKDGAELPVEISSNTITTSAGVFVIMTIVDITARVESSKNLSAALAERDELRRRFIQAQEDERLRLAHDLHDQTGQSLTAAMLELKDLESLLMDEGKDRARTLRHSMEQMGKTIHRIAWELRPASIDELGLTSTLANYVSDWSSQFGIEADFHNRDEWLDHIPVESQTAIYRIVQEGLTNVAKHAAGATSVSVILNRSDGTLQLTIEDNGRGFRTPVADGTADSRGEIGLGLAGMRERLTLIGGELEIESSAGVGTTIYARIPLDKVRMTA
jgi:PAS domain S-box-containing protein